MIFEPSESQIVIFDTEYTTWEGAFERNWSGVGEYREIVQIGAIKINTKTLNELDAITIYVKPVKNPELSSYFTSLTGITQKTADSRGLSYRDALKEFANWSDELPLYSWGADREVMQENAKLLEIPFPIGDTRFKDVREIFQKYGIPTDNYMSSTIPTAFGKKPLGYGHDALNDARSIIQGLRLLAEQQGL